MKVKMERLHSKLNKLAPYKKIFAALYTKLSLPSVRVVGFERRIGPGFLQQKSSSTEDLAGPYFQSV